MWKYLISIKSLNVLDTPELQVYLLFCGIPRYYELKLLLRYGVVRTTLCEILRMCYKDVTHRDSALSNEDMLSIALQTPVSNVDAYISRFVAKCLKQGVCNA